MKCPRCGFDGDMQNNICPNCHVSVVNMGVNNNVQDMQINNGVPNESVEYSPINNVVTPVNNIVNNSMENVDVSPVDNNQVANNDEIGNTHSIENVVQEESVSREEIVSGEINNEKKDMSKIYYIILSIAVLVFLILMSFILVSHFKKPKNREEVTRPTTTEKIVETHLSKNKGIYTNLISPTYIGNITYGGLKDNKSEKIIDADVQILRYLTANEINSVLVSSNQTLNPGFKWDGVEYQVTLNDFDYLNGNTINPMMKTYLFDTYYKNNFFLVNENYYTISPIYGSSTEIRNGESANLVVVYQVPIDQNYYICFGENFSSLGCFINS